MIQYEHRSNNHHLMNYYDSNLGIFWGEVFQIEMIMWGVSLLALIIKYFFGLYFISPIEITSWYYEKLYHFVKKIEHPL